MESYTDTKRYMETISIISAVAGSRLPPNSMGGLKAAERLELVSGYCMDGYQFDALILYFYRNWAYTKNANSAIYALADICFRLGYLKGGRAAMKGKFKEPPRRRNKK